MMNNAGINVQFGMNHVNFSSEKKTKNITAFSGMVH